MKRWMFQLAFGLALGVIARALLPGHHSEGYLAPGMLSLVGAAVGGAVAECILPSDLLQQGSFVLAGMGAIATLLIQAVVAG